MKGVCEEFFEKVGMKKKVSYAPNPERIISIQDVRRMFIMMADFWGI